MTITEKLYEIQQEIKVNKTQYSEYGDYYFRDCDDILNALKPIMQKLKCIIKLNDEVVLIGDRYYLKATATLKDCESDAFESCSALAREDLERKKMDCSQLTGTASSYARKYALNGLLALDDARDSDSINAKEDDIEKHNIFRIKERVEKIITEKISSGITKEEILKALSLNEKQMQQFLDSYERLNKFESALKRITNDKK